MKIKRKQPTLNGAKSSITQNESKSDAKPDFKLDTTKIDITKTDLNQLNKSIDKKDKMPICTNEGTSNGSFKNGLTTVDNDSKNKSANLVNSKNLSFKEKKKFTNNGLNSSFKDDECLKNNDKSQSNEQSNSDEKEDSKNNLNLSTGINSLNVYNNLDISTNSNKNTSDTTNNPKETSDLLSENNSVLNSKNLKRDLDSEIPTLKKKIRYDNDKNIEIKDVSTETTNASTMTEPDCLGFAEPGTSIVLEGAVLDEIEGVLVVNVTWRGKTYVGTLLDCTKHDWAPPRFCDSPTSDLESRGGFMRNSKRSKDSVSESENNIKLQQSKLRNGKGRRNFTVPVSPKQDQQQSTNNNSCNAKRSNNSKSDSTTKQRSTPPLSNSNSANNTSNSTSNTQSNQNKNQQSSPILIECPEPNCNKKYKHINGLKYHQTHAHHDTNNSQNSSKSSLNNNTNKDNEETTDTEDCVEDNETSSLTTKNKKLSSSKINKGNDEDKNRSPYSDISDDTENENESRPSSNNSAQTSQSTNNIVVKNDEKPEKALSNSEIQNDTSSIINKDDKDDQKTNEELRRLVSDIDQKITEQQSSIGIDKLLLNSSIETNQPNSLLSSNNNPALAKTNNFLIPPNFTMDPALHAYLMQFDLNYRLGYERYFNEHQEKLLGQFTTNELNSLSELEKERHKNFSLANQNKDNSIFKLPSSNHLQTSLTPRQSTSKANDRPPSNSLTTSISGGSIVNGTSNMSQNINNQLNKQNLPSPYDFLEFEQFGSKPREEMFRLNSNFKTTLPHSSSPQQQQQNSSPNKKLSLKDVQQTGTNQLNKIMKQEDSIKSNQQINCLPPNFFNFQTSPYNHINPSSSTNQHLPIISTNFSPTTTVHQSLPFDPNLFRTGQTSYFNSPSLIESYRFANSGLSSIDLNNVSNASKLLTNSQQAALLNNSSNQELSMIFPKSSATLASSNGSHRTLTTNSSQSSSSVLNTSNNVTISTSNKKDENRSPPLRLNSQHVGVGFQAAPFIDPYGELIQQAAASTLIPYATK